MCPWCALGAIFNRVFTVHRRGADELACKPEEVAGFAAPFRICHNPPELHRNERALLNISHGSPRSCANLCHLIVIGIHCAVPTQGPTLSVCVTTRTRDSRVARRTASLGAGAISDIR